MTESRLAEQLTVSLPPVMVRSLQERAEREGVALGDLVRQAVEGALTPPAPRRRRSGSRDSR
jgi:hypothetical protein